MTNRLRRSGPIILTGLIALFLLLPLWLLIANAFDVGWNAIHAALFRSRTATLLRHTIELCLIVGILAMCIGVAVAWFTERLSLPFRKLWVVLLVLPVSIPDFVTGYAWHSFARDLNGLKGATLVMTLGTYPLVYLPVAAAFRRADPNYDDVARSLGSGRVRTMLRVTLPLISPAILGGCVLVMLTVLSEYGAFEILRYQTFTTEIFTEFKFDPPAAASQSLVLVLLGMLVLGLDALATRRLGRTASRVSMARRQSKKIMGAAIVAMAALIALGVGVPIATLIYWLNQSQSTTLPAAATVASATGSTLLYSALGAAVSVILAVPVAMTTFRKTSHIRNSLERSTYITQALPGVVIALSFVYLTTRYVSGLYQSATLLVLAYAVMHFPLALVCIKASVAQASPTFADVATSLGHGPFSVFRRVIIPLIAPGLVASYCLVFLTAVTELTATLVLAPIGVETLATQFWAFQREVAYGAAAPYALMIIVIAMVPSALLALWFDRERNTQAGELA